MTKKKNLSKDNLSEIDVFESENNGGIKPLPPKIKIEDITIKVKCLTEKQKELKKLIEEKDVVIVSGTSGVGKTFFSLLMALHLLKTEPKYKKIVLIKSLITIKDEGVGYLKGTLDEKLAPFMYSFTGNLDKILGKAIRKQLMDSGVIEIMPIAYCRGVNVDHALCIIDEVENITMDTFKTIITRIGTDSKFIFLGDVEQCDRSNKKESCLAKVIQMFKDKDFIGTIEFGDQDCVRNPLIPKILDVLNNQ
jgi:phosphate starvation-inducible PhoH-like protein